MTSYPIKSMSVEAFRERSHGPASGIADDRQALEKQLPDLMSLNHEKRGSKPGQNSDEKKSGGKEKKADNYTPGHLYQMMDAYKAGKLSKADADWLYREFFKSGGVVTKEKAEDAAVKASSLIAAGQDGLRTGRLSVRAGEPGSLEQLSNVISWAVNSEDGRRRYEYYYRSAKESGLSPERLQMLLRIDASEASGRDEKKLSEAERRKTVENAALKTESTAAAYTPEHLSEILRLEDPEVTDELAVALHGSLELLLLIRQNRGNTPDPALVDAAAKAVASKTSISINKEVSEQ